MIRIRSFHDASWALLLLFICVALDGTNAFLYPSAVRLLQWRKSSSTQRFSSTSSSSSSGGESSATQRLASTTPSTPPQLQRQRRDFEIRPLFSSLVTAGNNSSSNNNNKSTWMSTIQGISNVASVLCVLDCTVLPLLTLTLPLVGWWSTAPWQHTLCVWSHHLALYFVLPLGSFMSLWNYYVGGHSQKTAILSLAWGGLLLIGITNAPPESILTACSSSTKVTMVLEALHHGMWHRIVNLVGCAMLLGSNYLAQLLGCNCGLVFCVPKKKQQQNLLLQVTAVQQQQQTKMMIPYKYHQQQRMILPPLNDDPTTTTNNKDKDVEGEDVGSTRSLKNL